VWDYCECVLVLLGRTTNWRYMKWRDVMCITCCPQWLRDTLSLVPWTWLQLAWLPKLWAALWQQLSTLWSQWVRTTLSVWMALWETLTFTQLEVPNYNHSAHTLLLRQHVHHYNAHAAFSFFYWNLVCKDNLLSLCDSWHPPTSWLRQHSTIKMQHNSEDLSFTGRFHTPTTVSHYH